MYLPGKGGIFVKEQHMRGRENKIRSLGGEVQSGNCNYSNKMRFYPEGMGPRVSRAQ